MIVEVRAAEGGDDAKALVREQVAVYEKLSQRRSWRLEIIEVLPATVTLRVTGKGADELFRDEPGGHRWQRIPPNERRGRVHTSTVTVAVLPEARPTDIEVRPADLDVETARGSGPGGQHRNTSDTCVVVRHGPTGIVVRCDAERSQHRNRELAMAVLYARLTARQRTQDEGDRAARRRRQVGSGMRGDKRRTIRCQDGVVTDHPTGRRWRLREYLRGEW